MKYILGVLIAIALILPLDMATAEEPGAQGYLTNYITDSEVHQYFFINCESDDCRLIMDQILNNATNEVSSRKIITDEEYLSEESVAAETTVVPMNEPEEEQSLPEENLLPEPEIDSPAEAAGSGGDESDLAEESGGLTEPEVVLTEEAETLPLQAEFQSVRISEVMSSPETGQKEWVELFNSSAQPIDLADWQLEEGSARKTILSGILEPQSYLVVEKSSLNNDGDTLILRDSGGQLIDQMSYGSWDDGNVSDNAPAVKTKNSIILLNGKYCETESPTPGALNVLTPEETIVPVPSQSEEVNPLTAVIEETVVESETSVVAEPLVETEEPVVEDSTEVQYQLSDKIRINELLANPAGDDGSEWIELYNFGDADIDLLGWTLDDSAGGSSPFLIEESLIIKAKDYLLLPRSLTQLALNNTSDSAVLIDPEDNIVSSFDYSRTKESKSWAFFEEGWEETSALTPSSANERESLQTASVASSPAKAAASIAESNLTEIKQLPLKSKVKLKGQIVSLPGTFSTKIAYLNGIQLYMNSADWPELSVGDFVQVSGAVSESQGERRILISKKEDISILENMKPDLPLLVNSTEISERYEGYLVQLAGELVEKSGLRLTFADDSGEFIVYLKRAAGLDSNIYNVGDRFKISGILSQTGEEFRLLPRSKDDMENLSALEKPMLGAFAEGSSELSGNSDQAKTVGVILSLAGTFAGVNMYFLWKKREILRKYFSGMLKRREIPA
ncbi:lamin tail domain-containing protein [Patescibacteria group bacterium]|nr:lamin tail domain-containing protein [Patescibacteria group bacterium]